MSDARVRAALEQMEAWLRDPASMPGPEGLADWNRELSEALAEAERGADWNDLVRRAQALAPTLEGRVSALAAERDEVRREMSVQARGERALKGYGATTR